MWIVILSEVKSTPSRDWSEGADMQTDLGLLHLHIPWYHLFLMFCNAYIFRYILTCGSDGDVRVWDGVDDDNAISHRCGDKAYSVAFTVLRINWAKLTLKMSSNVGTDDSCVFLVFLNTFKSAMHTIYMKCQALVSLKNYLKKKKKWIFICCICDWYFKGERNPKRFCALK